ncbi:HNH endonuclease [Sphingomonas sp.]|uniref:HNH endonuclease n=1 Tax=Sphingomonas sp. TaxID=28214 RepID=UPI003CC61C90
MAWQDTGKHAAFMCLWLQYDHLLPNSRGGESSIDNVVVTCAACNFGRMEATLEEARLENPFLRERDPKREPCAWDGLERLLGPCGPSSHA